MNKVYEVLGGWGRRLFCFFKSVRQIFLLSWQTVKWLLTAPLSRKKIEWHDVFVQVVRIGVDSLPIVIVISFFIGLILAMQAAYQLHQFGASIYVANLVGVSITRELGPLITAILVTGRCGSAITAELGTMKVGEEIDALKTMSIDPIGFLAVPRTLAMLVVLPCLTILADLVGIGGGVLFAVTQLEIPFSAYFRQSAEAILAKDFITGLLKSGVFAVIVSQIGIYQGFQVRGGAEGVGKSTTISVVSAIFLIILADVVFTALFYSTF